MSRARARPARARVPFGASARDFVKSDSAALRAPAARWVYGAIEVSFSFVGVVRLSVGDDAVTSTN